MTCACEQTCPSPVQTVYRSENTYEGVPDVEVSFTPIVPGVQFEVTAQVSEDLDIPWLIRFWFTDSYLTDTLSQESLQVPDTPGANQFYKVTDVNGRCVFTLSHTGSMIKYLNASVVGRVTTSAAIVFS